MYLLEHAKIELALINKDPTDEMQKKMEDDILEIVEVFSKQGHSGFSASYAIHILEKVLRFQPISPLTGQDSEWNDVSEFSGMETGTFFQNNRCSRVFKDITTNEVYDIEGIIWEDEDGCTFTNKQSHVPVTFPYIPTTIHKKCEPES